VRLCIQDPLDPGVSYLSETLRPILVGYISFKSGTSILDFSYHFL